MPKQATKAEVNSFVKGLISEASPLNFPPNCSLDEYNYELNRDGTRNRRLGFDVEASHSFIAAPAAISTLEQMSPETFRWSEVGGISGKVLLVVQIANKLSFFDMEKESISADGLVGTHTLATFPTSTKYSFSSVDGKLVVAAGIASIAVITYSDTPSISFTSTISSIKTRDVWGVDSQDSYESDPKARELVISNAHRYNLYNQSWGIPRKNEAGTLLDPIDIYKGTILKYPSNSELVWPGLQFQPVTSGTPFERMYPNLYNDTMGSDTVVSKGYFIIDAVNRGASRTAAVNANKVRFPQLSLFTFTPPADYTDGGCSVMEGFAGRIFFSGFSGKTVSGDSRSPVLSNFIFFSQLVKNANDIFKCYQEGDPTSRENNEVVDTDGGFIRIAGAERIIKLVSVGNSLIVIATNGVWAVMGGGDEGFKATNYRVDKVSTFGGISAASVVPEKARVFYWSEDGINVVMKDQIGVFIVESITAPTIKKLYQAIPSSEKEKASGIFDPIANKIRWIYEEDSDTIELLFDLSLMAFYKHRIKPIAGSDVKISNLFLVPSFNSVSTNDSVYVGTDLVLESASEVVVPSTVYSNSIVSVKYVCISTVAGVVSFAFGYYRNTDFRDWQRIDGIGNDAKAFMLTGSQTAGDSSVNKQVQYLTMHFTRTESGFSSPTVPLTPSSCLVRMQWDWSGNANSSKWSALKQAYRYSKNYEYSGPSDTFDTGFDVLTTKNMIRGRGRSFALYIETEPYKDCKLLGWSVSVDGNGKV